MSSRLSDLSLVVRKLATPAAESGLLHPLFLLVWVHHAVPLWYGIGGALVQVPLVSS